MEANSDVLITVDPGLETDRLVQFEAGLTIGLVTVVEVVVVAVEPEARDGGQPGGDVVQTYASEVI